MKPYYNNQQVPPHLTVTCGRCENEFSVHLKKRKDHPTVICPKCKAENRLQIIWK